MNFTSIDWNLIFDLLKSISIIIASGVAIYGINSWRRETKWKRKYELAEETLSLFYEVQDAVSIIRNPMAYEGEGRTRKRSDNESPEDSEILDRAYTVIERFEKNSEPFHKLKAIKYRFITVFGKESEKPFNEIIKITNKIMLVSRFLGNRYWKEQGRKNFSEEQFKNHINQMHEYESIIWERYHSDKDEIKDKLDDTVNEIESICNKVLKKK